MGYHLTEPYRAPAQVAAKNRVMGFRCEIGINVRKSAPQPVESHREKHPTPTKPASGIPYWLSRDPIGERGGLNLYGFAGNDGVNRWDYLGQSYVDVETFAQKPVYRDNPGNNPFIKPRAFTEFSCNVECECDSKSKEWSLVYRLTLSAEIRIKTGEEDAKGAYGHEQRHILSGWQKALDQIKPMMDKEESLDQNKFGSGNRGKKKCDDAALSCFSAKTFEIACDKKVNGEKDHAGDPTASEYSPGTLDTYPPLPRTEEVLRSL